LSPPLIFHCDRETERRAEIEKLVAEGKVPHEIELQKNPEKSIEGMACTLPPHPFMFEIC
jgi:hypothetical protein